MPRVGVFPQVSGVEVLQSQCISATCVYDSVAKMPGCHRAVVKLSVICHLRSLEPLRSRASGLPLSGVEVMNDDGVLGFDARVFACWENAAA